MKFRPLSAVLAGVLLVVQGCASTAPQSSGSAADAGMRVYKDPATGGFAAPQPGAPAAAAPANGRVSTSAAGLVETEGTSAGGGIRLDLQGRFRSYAIATKDEQGRITVRCEPNAPHAH